MEQYVLAIGIAQDALARIQKELEGTEITLYATADIRDAVRQADRRPFSLVAADLHTARREDCVELTAALRRTGFIPILALMDYKAEGLSISALDIGVDICQPYTITPRLLAGQIKAALRRFTDYGRYEKPGDAVPFHRGDIYIDPQTRTAYVLGRPALLRPREFALLLYFMQNPNIVLTPDRICERAWRDGYSADVGRAVYELRRQIEPDPAHPIYILTEYRVGYRFTAYCSETCDEKESNRKTLGK